MLPCQDITRMAGLCYYIALVIVFCCETKALCCCAAAPSPLLHAPEWMKRPAGACFGFGGKLAAFKTVRAENGTKAVVTSIRQVGSRNPWQISAVGSISMQLAWSTGACIHGVQCPMSTASTSLACVCVCQSYAPS